MMETRNVLIRTGRPADLPSLTDIYNHYVETTSASFDMLPFTPEGRRHWFAQFSTEGPYRLVVAEIGGLVAGYASSGRFRDKAAYVSSVETEIFLAPAFRGQGLGRKLYDALFDLLACEDIHRAFAGITLPNEPATNLHRSLGFEKTGVLREAGRKFGKYWDVMLLAKEMPGLDVNSRGVVRV